MPDIASSNENTTVSGILTQLYRAPWSGAVEKSDFHRNTVYVQGGVLISLDTYVIPSTDNPLSGNHPFTKRKLKMRDYE